MDLPSEDPAANDSLVKSADHIRVTLVQPALPKYRIAVFRELANRPGIQLRVVYGSVPGLNNVAPDGFEGLYVQRTEWNCGGAVAMIHRAEWTYCSRRRSDVVVLRWGGRSVLLLPGMLRARACGVPVVLWGHGYSKNEKPWRARIRNWAASLATAIVFYDPKTRDAFASNGWNPKRLFVALNSIDHVPIEAARKWWVEHPDKLAHFRTEHGLGEGPVILFVSRLAPANRLDLLLQATAGLVSDFPALKTIIIGNGPNERRELALLANKLGVEDNVVFQDGIYDEFELAPWFLAADVFCYPANIGLSLIHSFWYGLPVVTSDYTAGQNPEIVALKRGINGELYQHENVASLVEALRKTVGDEAHRAKLSLSARQTVQHQFTVQSMVDGLEQAIRYAHSASAHAT
jgi:glycosyltransferase involved in cell wall biosynthesis